WNNANPASECEQIRKESTAVLGRKIDAEEVSAIAVAALRRVEAEAAHRFVAGHASRRLKPALLGIENVKAPDEGLGPLILRQQKIRQRRHGPIVQIRRAQPQPVEREIRVAVGFLEIAEPVFAAINVLEECELIVAKLLGITVEPGFIGAERAIRL